ncbi:MAG: thioredoxin family protein [Bacteroidales bacterium]|nr:thioredoxin family protein [Bacteroidales bacterium]
MKALGIITLILVLGCKSAVNNDNIAEGKAVLDISAGNEGKPMVSADTTQSDNSTYNVTFIELGSVRCIPCQHMQIVMKSIKEKYGKEVNVLFYDVWTPEGRPYGEKYGITAIPTQVFLDETGKEYSRHEGFFPEEELVKVLSMRGVR